MRTGGSHVQETPDSERAFPVDVRASGLVSSSAAFKGSPMKRAKLHGLKRNAAVVLGNVGTSEDYSAGSS
jgi:hypothetical protein